MTDRLLWEFAKYKLSKRPEDSSLMKYADQLWKRIVSKTAQHKEVEE